MQIGVRQAMEQRHSVRSFAGKPLSPEEITELLDAARQAPSSLNTQPWRFRVVTDPADLQWLGTREATRSQGWIATAPAVFVCCADLSGYVRDSQASAFFYRDNKIIEGDTMDGIDAYVNREAAATEQARFGAAAMNVGLAVSFLMLRAVEMGLGTCWVGMFDEANVKARFGIPETMRVVCLLAAGHPDEAQVFPRKRKSLDEIVLK